MWTVESIFMVFMFICTGVNISTAVNGRTKIPGIFLAIFTFLIGMWWLSKIMLGAVD